MATLASTASPTPYSSLNLSVFLVLHPRGRSCFFSQPDPFRLLPLKFLLPVALDLLEEALADALEDLTLLNDAPLLVDKTPGI